MVATAVIDKHPLQVGAPFYAGRARPGVEPGAPVLHKYDTDDFVPRFLAEVAQAARTDKRPESLLGAVKPLPVPDYDTDALDFLGVRLRKLYQPVHFRFYLAACELRCLVPGFPGPLPGKVKKVELVVRRVGLRKQAGSATATVEDREWAWVKVPEPELFPDTPPLAALELAPRLTGNTRTWWPLPRGQEALEGEQRFAMSRVPGLEGKAVYFAFVPVASGEMYGPRPTPDTPDTTPDTGTPPKPKSKWDVVPELPLVRAPSKLALRPASIRAWSSPDWRKVLGIFSGNKVNGPRPKFESPPLDYDPQKPSENDPDSGWAYVVRCVATVEHAPGCVLEHWGAPTEPMFIAPVFDPFGGRPTQVDLPSLRAITNMVGGLTSAQLAQRGGLGLGVSSPDPLPTVDEDMKIIDDPKMKEPQLCFWPIFVLTFLAYLMINIALAIIIIFQVTFAFFLKLKFCIGLVRKTA